MNTARLREVCTVNWWSSRSASAIDDARRNGNDPSLSVECHDASSCTLLDYRRRRASLPVVGYRHDGARSSVPSLANHEVARGEVACESKLSTQVLDACNAMLQADAPGCLAGVKDRTPRAKRTASPESNNP